jgi:pimeloyl-ACP methyl ester carboxylesterase
MGAYETRMKRDRQYVSAAVWVILGVAMATIAVNAQSDKTSLGGPLRLRDHGSFFVNGEVTGNIVVNQMYVQYWIPEGDRRLPPVVMVHGSGHTGKTYETTPDGREGWATYFVRQGIPVYVVDQPGRARSGFDVASVNRARTESNTVLLPNIGRFNNQAAWTTFRIGPTPFEAYPTTQFPIEAKEQYFAQLVPNTDATLAGPGDTQRIGALAALLDKIGPAIVMVHSMSGPHGIGVALARPNLVKALITLEPVSCAASDADVAKVFNHVPVLAVWGDFKDAFIDRGLTQCGNLVTRATAAGGKAKLLHLPAEGFVGNSHMLMMDRNNLKIADRIISWLRDNVK